MDPISTSASILTIVGAAGGTCKVLYNLILDFKGAPQDIRLQNVKLHNLHGNITYLLQICSKLPDEFQLATHLQGVQEFIQDINLISIDLQQRKDSLRRGRATRVKAICKWLLFDPHLKRFFDNLEHYNTIFLHALWAAQLSLLMQISVQTAVPPQLCSHVPGQHTIAPEIDLTTRSTNKIEVQHNASNPVAAVPLFEKRLLARLPRCVETAGMLLRHRHNFASGAFQLCLRNGPAVTRTWSRSGRGVYAAEGHTLSMTFQCSRFVRQRFTFVLYILYHTSYASKLSMRLNMSFSSIVPLENPGFKAIEVGDIDHLKQMITSGSFGMSAITPGGYTLLHCAARYGRIDILSMLIRNGADVNITNDRGETPLHISVKQGRGHECTRYLLELGADAYQPDVEGRTALHIFYNAVTAYMFQNYADDIDTWAQDKSGMTILHYLSWSSRSTAQDLLRCSATDSLPQLSIKDTQGKSVLHYATQRGNLDLIAFLLARPEVAALCMPDNLRRTLLHYATESSRTETIDLFISRGLDPNATDMNGHTVLHHACEWGNLKAVKHLINLGFAYQLDAVDHNKRTPLQAAKLYRSDAVVDYILKVRPNQTAGTEESSTGKERISGELTSLSRSIKVLSFSLFVFLIYHISLR